MIRAAPGPGRAHSGGLIGCALWCKIHPSSVQISRLQKRPPEGRVGRCPGWSPGRGGAPKRTLRLLRSIHHGRSIAILLSGEFASINNNLSKTLCLGRFSINNGTYSVRSPSVRLLPTANQNWSYSERTLVPIPDFLSSASAHCRIRSAPTHPEKSRPEIAPRRKGVSLMVWVSSTDIVSPSEIDTFSQLPSSRK